MTTSTPDIQPAVQHTAQVAIVGAGPVGLMMANYLGQMGISVLVVEKLATLDGQIGRAVQQECRDRSRMPSSA